MLKIDFTNRSAVIVGSGGALDLALVKAFTDHGARVALCCKPEDRPSAAELEACNRKVWFYDLDLLAFASLSDTVNQIKAEFGHIDILVNNPTHALASQARAPLHEQDLNGFVSACNAWLKGLMRFSKYCAQDMVSRKNGVIVNFLSSRGVCAVANQSVSVAVSAGLYGLSRMWGVEMRDDHIRANGIAVGVLEDEPSLECGDAVRFSHGNVKRPCKASEAAMAAVFLASDAASYITGTVLNVDGGISAGYARSF